MHVAECGSVPSVETGRSDDPVGGFISSDQASKKLTPPGIFISTPSLCLSLLCKSSKFTLLHIGVRDWPA